MNLKKLLALLLAVCMVLACTSCGSNTPAATTAPTTAPTAEPTAEPTEEPTAEPTVEPTEEPTVEPTEEPTAEPTEEPTEEPAAEATEEPAAEATEEPVAEVTEEPVAEATEEPAAQTVEAASANAAATDEAEATTTDVDDDPIVIQVGETILRKSDVQPYVDYYVSYYSATTDEQIAEVRDWVVDALAQQTVTEQKFVDLNCTLTEDEESSLQSQYNYYYTYIAYYYMGITDLSSIDETYDYYIRYYLNQMGINYSSMVYSAQYDKLYDLVTADIATVTDLEIEAAYDAAVASDTETYATAAAYADAVSNGTTVYYVPEGLRYVKNILIMKDADLSAYESSLTAKADEYKAAADELLNTMVEAGVTTATDLAEGDVCRLDDLLAYVTCEVVNESAATATDVDATATDVTTYEVPVLTVTSTATFDTTEDENLLTIEANVVEYASNVALQNAYTDLAAQADEEMWAVTAERADNVWELLNEGADFDEVMENYTEDTGMAASAYGTTGYLVYDGISFDEAFMDAVWTLEKPGDYSEKAKGIYGYYIVGYASEVESGVVPFEQVKDDAAAKALTSAKDAAFNAQVEAWMAEYYVNPEAMK